jgi:hypothetical protein
VSLPEKITGGMPDHDVRGLWAKDTSPVTELIENREVPPDVPSFVGHIED